MGMCGTIGYMAPEMIEKGSTYSYEIDNWCMGICLYGLITGTMPFMCEDMGKVNYLVQYGEPTYKEEGWYKCSNDAKVLVKGLLTKEPKKRLTAEGALKHKWLKKVD